MNIKRGDSVSYWTRRKGERPRRITGNVLDATGEYCRVDGHDSCIPVHTIATNRLTKTAPSPPDNISEDAATEQAQYYNGKVICRVCNKNNLLWRQKEDGSWRLYNPTTNKDHSCPQPKSRNNNEHPTP